MIQQKKSPPQYEKNKNHLHVIADRKKSEEMANFEVEGNLNLTHRE